ncbi:MAG TPA: hypothetical protein VM734_30840 [Kofleriaceae bacterium]|nr:hypothetical protein [Kofleriaceae bacterium]
MARCGRCEAPLCRAHTPAVGRRCRTCECDYRDDATVRNRMKAAIGLPPALLATVAVFGLLLPLAGAGMMGTLLIATSAALAGTGTAAGIFRAIDRTARAQFLREHGRALPMARLLPHR